MKKKLQFFLASILLISVYSCKKSDPTVTYSNFKITSVSISQVPSISSADDLTTNPDVYFNIEDANGTALYSGAESVGNSFYSNLIPSTQSPLVWPSPLTPFTPFIIPSTSNTYYIHALDSDDNTLVGTDDDLGKVSFKMDDYKNGYQTTIPLTSGTGTSLTITGTWY